MKVCNQENSQQNITICIQNWILFEKQEIKTTTTIKEMGQRIMLLCVYVRKGLKVARKRLSSHIPLTFVCVCP